MKNNKLLLLLILSLFFENKLVAQWNYWADLTSNLPGSYIDLGVLGTSITTNFDGNTMTYDDDNSSIQNIGFTFDFNGVAFTQFVLNSNGFIKLGNKAPYGKNIYYTIAQAIPSTPGSCITIPDSNLIYAMNHDLGQSSAGGLPEYRIHTTGWPGSRICTIQFKNLADKIGGEIIQFSNINFQIQLFEGSNEIDFVYGPWTSSGNPTNFIGNAVGIKGNSVTNTVNVSKSSVNEWFAVGFVNGNYWDNTHNVRNSVMDYALGRTYKFFSKKANDAKILSVFTYGKIPLPFVAPHVIAASVINYGLNELNNLPIKLTITGANYFSPPAKVISILPGDTAVVSFPIFNPSNIGTNNIIISVPADDNNNNNSKTVTQLVTNDSLSYSYLNNVSDSGIGGYGFGPGSSGQVATKFIMTSPAAIEQVTVSFLFPSIPYNICIWDKSGADTPGTILYLSPVLNTVRGKFSYPLPLPINVTDTFYVGVRQATTVQSFNLAYEAESPLRPNTFFVSSLSPVATPWIDLARNGFSRSKFSIEPGLIRGNNTTIKLCPGASTTITSNVIGSNYQWQVDTGSGFSNISNNSYYAGSNNAILQLNSPPSSMNGYQYRCVVDGTNSNTTRIKFVSYWTGSVSSAWEDPGNWVCHVVPDAGADVILYDGDTVIVNSTATCRTIVVNPGASLTIKPGFTLTVTN